MKPSIPLNKLLLLVTTALFAPSIAVAQTQQQPAEPPPTEEVAEEFGEEFGTDEIVVLGRNIPQPMRDTSEVVTVLSAEDLARQGDDNAALALTRLSGLSVVNSRFVYVRGLGDRYSSALLNGSPLPSPEPLRRQVPLDLFPSNILDGANVQKTFSSNYPGEFGGGVIDLRTLRIPVDNFLTVKLATGGNTEAWGGRGLTYRGESSDWSGIADGLRDIPTPIANAISSGRQINQTNFTDAQIEVFGESLINSPLTVVQEEDFKPDFEGEVTGGASLDFGKYNLGLVGVFGYDSAIRSQTATRQFGRDALAVDSISRSTTWDIVANMFGSASLGWDENEVTLTGFLVRSTSKDAQIDDIAFDSGAPGIGQQEQSTAWYERQLATIQVAGEHRFGALDLEWRTAFAQSKRDAPYERSILYDITPLFPTGIYSGRTLGNQTRFSDLTDEVASAGVDGDYTIELSEERDAVLSAGLAYSNNVREYNLRTFSFFEGSTDPLLIPNSVRVSRPDFLFQPDNIRPDGFFLQERTGPDDSYKARMTIMAAYAAADVEVIPLVRASVGVRYEDATETVRTFNTYGAAPFFGPVAISNAYYLPAATLTWNFAEDLQLRAGYSQTIARPQFRELAFTPYIDPETDREYQGNPFLSDSEFQNYDARLEYYFGRNQFVTVGGFYKIIADPIEEVVFAVGENGFATRFTNAPEATLYGAEFEYRTRFDMPFEVPLMEGADWLFAVNYTYTSSEVSGDGLIVDPSRIQPGVTRADTLRPAAESGFDGGALQGTPEHIANLQFGFESDVSQMTLLVGWVDERIARRGLGGLASVIEDPGVNVDLTYRRDFTIAERDLSFSFSARNLLGEDHIEYQALGGGGEAQVNTYARGQSVSLGLTARF